MAKLIEARSSAVEFDGELIDVINCPLMTLATTAVSDQGAYVAPCDFEIVRADLSVIATPTSSAAALNIGTHGDPDKFLDAYSLTDLATGHHRIEAASFATTAISAGDLVEFETEAATAVGSVAVSLVVKPASQG